MSGTAQGARFWGEQRQIKAFPDPAEFQSSLLESANKIQLIVKEKATLPEHDIP